MAKTKILYVEDEPFLGRIVKESLESRDFDVTMVVDGKEVMTIFKNLHPHICVLDIMLPGKDGYTLAKEIRNASPQMPIIFVTAKIQTEDLIKGFESGGNDYLKKPFSMEELIVRVNNLLQLSQHKNGKIQEAIIIGEYEFDAHRYELRRQDAVRKLSHRESTLLQVLVESKNATIKRRDILMKLWGDDSFFNSRNLDVYITKLRDYLKDDSSIQIITIKGIGYRFAVGYYFTSSL
jgi:DNA-binding response OmpR family regulator